ncbi:tyrosine-type recombinase/integrase [Saccharomonospora cyanea]|nr:tyrosine-type recombinase/integrase [Saccharomonospora cyanea]
MASVEKLPSGRWRGRYVDADGKKRWLRGSFPRKSDALDAAVEAQAKAKRRAAATTGELSARTSWRDWWRILADEKTHISDHGVKERQNVDKHVLPRWGDVPLAGIKRGDVQAWVDELCRKGYSANYVRNIYGPLQRSINTAVTRGVLEASPLVGIKLPRRPKQAKTYVEAGEPGKLRDHLNPVFVDACEYMLEVGCRPNEMAGLHADQVDLENGWVMIRDVFVQKLRVIRAHPKDGDARRVPLSSRAIEIIRKHLDGRDLTAGCGVPHLDGSMCRSVLVFRNVRGGVLHPDLLSRRMREAALAAGLPAKSAYALRRGFATRVIEGGADVFAVQRVMGHADLSELAGYVQETRQARARMLAALGEVAPLAAVDPRGPGRGPDFDNQALPDVPAGGDADTA